MSKDFLKKVLKYENFMKIRAVGAELFHAERWTDVTKAITAFRIFQSTPIFECNINSLVGFVAHYSVI